MQQIRQNLEKNAYWMSLMQGLQSDDTQPKTLLSVSNIVERYSDLTVEVLFSLHRELCVCKIDI